MPSYRPPLTWEVRSQPGPLTVTVQSPTTCNRKWSPGVEDGLRDCFKTIAWDVLLNPHDEDIEGMAHCLTDYLNFCVDVVSPAQAVRCHPNNKPWLTQEVKAVLNRKNMAFMTKEREAIN